jgi:hypothetical protein
MAYGDKFKELKDEHRRAKMAQMDLEHQMAEEVMHFNGTLQQAIDCGMVKYNFPVPRHSRLNREQEAIIRKVKSLG